jgi:hypothetical protein
MSPVSLDPLRGLLLQCGMAASGEPASSENPEAPVFGPHFVGRAGLVRNLLNRCASRQSVLVYGGPKLGKTSLLHHLKWCLEQPRASSSEPAQAALYVDLNEDASHDRLLAGPYDRSAVFLLDNCDRLVKTHLPAVEAMQGTAQAIVWAGGRSWLDFVRSGRSSPVSQSSPLVPVPLAIFLEKEARELVGADLTPDQRDTVLAYGGTHPYVLKKLRAGMIAAGQRADPTDLLRTTQSSLAPFFSACVDAIREPSEQTLLDYLIAQTRPVNPAEAARALGLPTIKPAADALCYLGLISRWIRDEEATLLASCRLFNDWYQAHPPQLS